MADLEAQIDSRIPHGPIRLVGYSMGGHFGYAAALRLKAAGREIAGFCAIDSFMTESLAPSPGWRTRALSEGLRILRKGRLHGAQCYDLRPISRLFSLEQLSAIVAFEKVFEAELTLHNLDS